MFAFRTAMVATLISACATTGGDDVATVATDLAVAAPDHIVIVLEENHSYDELIGNSGAPFLNWLAQKGVLFTQSYAAEHPSQPNYLVLFSGNDQGVHDDSCPHTFGGPNLASSLIAAGKTFGTYSEDLPSTGSGACTSGNYARKHAPWTNFTNVPANVQQSITAWPSDFTQLPTVSFVIPNLQNDMHDGTVNQGDTWAAQHLGDYANWALTHNSLLIVQFDEDDNTPTNRIPTIVMGQPVRAMTYNQHIDHVSLLRLVLDLYHLSPFSGAATTTPIDDIWALPSTSSYQRTVVFIHGQTNPGQDMFVRGGIDYTYAKQHLGKDCNANPHDCRIGIRHRNLANPSTAGLDHDDNYLDWVGAEVGQDQAAQGSPADWTTDVWPASYGPAKSVATDGYGTTPINTWGPHEWMLDVDMDCSTTVNGWFEVKSFISNGPGWEPDISQAGAPYTTGNHFAKCGQINRFVRGAATAETSAF